VPWDDKTIENDGAYCEWSCFPASLRDIQVKFLEKHMLGKPKVPASGILKDYKAFPKSL
jgi:hypothetical protein